MDKNISILGVGKLGLCLALNLERKGFNLIGVDVSQHYVDSLNEKAFTTTEPHVNEYLKESQNIKFTTKELIGKYAFISIYIIRYLPI